MGKNREQVLLSKKQQEQVKQLPETIRANFADNLQALSDYLSVIKFGGGLRGVYLAMARNVLNYEGNHQYTPISRLPLIESSQLKETGLNNLGTEELQVYRIDDISRPEAFPLLNQWANITAFYMGSSKRDGGVGLPGFGVTAPERTNVIPVVGMQSHNGYLRGVSALSIWEEQKGGNEISKLTRFATREDVRGQGIGQLMMKAALSSLSTPVSYLEARFGVPAYVLRQQARTKTPAVQIFSGQDRTGLYLRNGFVLPAGPPKENNGLVNLPLMRVVHPTESSLVGRRQRLQDEYRKISVAVHLPFEEQQDRLAEVIQEFELLTRDVQSRTGIILN